MKKPYGDIDEFIRLYPEFEKLNVMLKREVVFSVVSAGQIDILEYIIQRLGDGFKDLIKFDEIIVFAAKVAFDNTRMLDYIYNVFDPDLAGRWTAVTDTMISYGGVGANTHINNIRYLLSQIPDEELRRRSANPLKYIIRRGWNDYFKELAGRLQISPDRWDMLLPNAIVSGNQDLVDFIKPHISPNFDYANVLSAASDSLSFKRVLALPEITREVILRYLRQFHHLSRLKHATTLDLILESGKVSQEDINNIH